MEATLKEALKKETWEICQLIMTGNESFKIVACLSKQESDADRNYVKTANQFFYHTMIMNWRITVLELSKLLSKRKSDEYRLPAFINQLKPGGKYESALISPTKINDWETAIETEADHIKNLLEQRDKLYAHTDRDAAAFSNKVSIEKARALFEILTTVIKEIYIEVFESSFMVDPIGSPVESLDKVIDTLTNDKKDRDAALKALCIAHGITDEFK
ncbi:MAG: hypothetical protein QM726_04245 [Chitinophagaceae bacterium]